RYSCPLHSCLLFPYTTLFRSVSLLPTLLGMTGPIYLAGALALGLWFLYSGVRVAVDRTVLRARAVLIVSVLYLPLIYGLMLIDRDRKSTRLNSSHEWISYAVF